MHPIKELVTKYKSGEKVGIFSVCCSNKYVIEAAMDRLKNKEMYLLIESTANQVDQFGGYTGMIPKDFVKYIHNLAEENDFPVDRIILGGDHLGPLTWTKLGEEKAMENAKTLIRDYVLAGFTKIHIDTSMPIIGDFEKGVFGDELISERAAILCKVAEDAFTELLKEKPESVHPVYVIGSEVPIPGGAQADEQEGEGISVTKVENLVNTIETFKDAFERYGVSDSWQHVVGVVVQPGVEFGSEQVWQYDREKASKLSEVLRNYPDLVFEAHSTDYQTNKSLNEMIEAGFIILKVGPALTYGFREAAFELNIMENEILRYNANLEISKFREILEFNMVKNNGYWKNHYSGTKEKIKFDRIYGLSDRCRYYLPIEEVNYSLEKMIDNLKKVDIPMTLVSQYMHNQYKKIRNGEMELTVENLIKDRVGEYIDDYIYAVENNKVS